MASWIVASFILSAGHVRPWPASCSSSSHLPLIARQISVGAVTWNPIGRSSGLRLPLQCDHVDRFLMRCQQHTERFVWSTTCAVIRNWTAPYLFRLGSLTVKILWMPMFLNTTSLHFDQDWDGPVRLRQKAAYSKSSSSQSRRIMQHIRIKSALDLKMNMASRKRPEELSQPSQLEEQCSFRWFSPQQACGLLSRPPTTLIFIGDRYGKSKAA